MGIKFVIDRLQKPYRRTGAIAVVLDTIVHKEAIEPVSNPMPLPCLFGVGFLLIMCVCIFLLHRYFCIVTVHSSSMFPTLQDHDRVLVFRRWPEKWLRKDQIVIIWHTPSELLQENWPQKSRITPYIKRVTGLPGETVVTKFEELNGSLQELLHHQFDQNGKKVHHILEGYIFVESDNPAGGLDSHCWGPLSTAGVLGIVLMKLSPAGKPDSESWHKTSQLE